MDLTAQKEDGDDEEPWLIVDLDEDFKDVSDSPRLAAVGSPTGTSTASFSSATRAAIEAGASMADPAVLVEKSDVAQRTHTAVCLHAGGTLRLTRGRA